MALVFGKFSALHDVSVPVQIVEVVGRHEMNQSVRRVFNVRVQLWAKE